MSPLFSLLQKENLGEPHTIFAGGERYFSPRFSRVAAEVFRRELAEAGLGNEADYLDFVDMVGVVQRATTEFYGWVTGVDEHYGILVASHGRHAVSLRRSGDSVSFERCDAERTLDTLVANLPDVPAGQGDAISVSHADFHAGSRAPGSVMRRSSAARPEAARRLDALLDVRRRFVTKIYAAKKDDQGVRTRSSRWVTVLDLVDGRWVLSVGQSRQERWIRVAPGTPRLISDRLSELARTVR
ncbi:ESX secretion-associated protein EspG [Actinophytocola oryzae]|uniref:ESX secretion-associated protein EspG n=1 Tax=Actinophytocola oryzae TaxID=502181 RepID=UPI001AAE2FAB|nr:ESX secretion-associated protein EspG [Actinophytocola oryzae]